MQEGEGAAIPKKLNSNFGKKRHNLAKAQERSRCLYRGVNEEYRRTIDPGLIKTKISGSLPIFTLLTGKDAAQNL